MHPREGIVARKAARPPLVLEAVEHGEAAVAQEDEDRDASGRPAVLGGDPVDLGLFPWRIMTVDDGAQTHHAYCIAIRRLIRCCVALPRVARRVQEDTKVPLSLRMDRELYEWLVKKRDSGRFYNLTHAIEESVRALQRQEK